VVRKLKSTTNAGTRPSRNAIAVRVTHRERGKRQVDLAQVKDVIARYWDELASLPAEDSIAVFSAEIAAAERRRRGSRS